MEFDLLFFDLPSSFDKDLMLLLPSGFHQGMLFLKVQQLKYRIPMQRVKVLWLLDYKIELKFLATFYNWTEGRDVFRVL